MYGVKSEILLYISCPPLPLSTWDTVVSTVERFGAPFWRFSCPLSVSAHTIHIKHTHGIFFSFSYVHRAVAYILKTKTLHQEGVPSSIFDLSHSFQPGHTIPQYGCNHENIWWLY